MPAVQGSTTTGAAGDATVARLRAAGCVYAEQEAALLHAAATGPAELAALVDRRVSGLPLEYVLGWAAFADRRILVEPGVFVPRRRTELLAREAVRAGAAVPAGHPAVVVELCCGTGAVATVLVAALAGARAYAVDIDPVAVRCARRNLAGTGARVYRGDLYRPLPARLRGQVDVLVANAPYVPSAEIGLLPPEAREHEPLAALDGGTDGLAVLRRVAAGAPDWLVPGGTVLMESSRRQARALAAAVTRAGLAARTVHDPDAGATVVTGTRA